MRSKRQYVAIRYLIFIVDSSKKFPRLPKCIVPMNLLVHRNLLLILQNHQFQVFVIIFLSSKYFCLDLRQMLRNNVSMAAGEFIS